MSGRERCGSGSSSELSGQNGSYGYYFSACTEEESGYVRLKQFISEEPASRKIIERLIKELHSSASAGGEERIRDEEECLYAYNRLQEAISQGGSVPEELSGGSDERRRICSELGRYLRAYEGSGDSTVFLNRRTEEMCRLEESFPDDD